MIREIYDLLYRLGINATYKGFFHASYATLLATENLERLLLVTKWLYPEVAKKYHTTPECVERNIRTVAAVAWRNNPELLREITRCQLSDQSTAAQFVAILATYLAYSVEGVCNEQA